MRLQRTQMAADEVARLPLRLRLRRLASANKRYAMCLVARRPILQQRLRHLVLVKKRYGLRLMVSNLSFYLLFVRVFSFSPLHF